MRSTREPKQCSRTNHIEIVSSRKLNQKTSKTTITRINQKPQKFKLIPKLIGALQQSVKHCV
ncbi:hypothetical protein WB44_09920 [Synechococcus sp. WH 8020]|nr:hypothetical protein WB44_09920 [Synechococcus sp. WH 8020]